MGGLWETRNVLSQNPVEDQSQHWDGGGAPLVVVSAPTYPLHSWAAQDRRCSVPPWPSDTDTLPSVPWEQGTALANTR